jgi:hypothetical protein
MFVSGCFKGEISKKLEKIFLETGVNGSALSIADALTAADKIKSGEMTLPDFEKKLCNGEFKI